MPQVSLPTTKHFQVAQQLRRAIKQLQPGHPLPTQRNLMQRFGASQATIERAIRRLQREGLVHRPPGTRRLVVRESADPAALRLALVRPDWPSLVYEGVCRAVASCGRPQDWVFNYVSYRSMQNIDLESLVQQNDAIMLMPTSEPIPPRLQRVLAKPPIPIVVTQDSREDLTASLVCMNDRQMARLATRYLQDLGHRSVLLVLATLGTGPMQQALAGWREAMLAAGVHDLEPLIVNADTQPFTDVRVSVRDAMRGWLERPHPAFSAMYVANAPMSVLRAFSEKGIAVPQDVSIVAADAIVQECEFMIPSLTAIDVDMKRFGEAVVNLVTAQVAGQLTGPNTIWIDAELVVRESTRPFAGGGVPAAGA